MPRLILCRFGNCWPTFSLAENAGLAAAGYRVQYYQLLAQPFYLAAMVLLAASVSLRSFRFGGVQRMVLGGVAGGLPALRDVESDRGLEQGWADVAGDCRRSAAACRRANGFNDAAVPGGRVMAVDHRSSISTGLRLVACGRKGGCRWRAGARRHRPSSIATAPSASRSAAASSHSRNVRSRPRPATGCSARRRIRKIRCSCARPRSTTTTPTSASRRSATCRSTIQARRWKPTRSSTTRRPSGCTREGNVRLSEADGKVIYGEIIDLSDDFRDGFVDSLRVDGPEQTRFAANRADRTQRQRHGLPERRLHGLRALQGRSDEAAEMAGQGRPDHPRSGREDDVLRGRSLRVLRRAARLDALFLDARSDRQAQERLPRPDLSHELASTASASPRPTTSRSRPTTTPR